MGYALDLLNKEYDYKPPVSNELYNPVLLGIAGFASIAFSNYIMRKPLLSGMHFVNIQEEKLCKFKIKFQASRDTLH